MTETPEPQGVREIVDRLEEENVDVELAAAQASDDTAEDSTRSVPGAPEPPD